MGLRKFLTLKVIPVLLVLLSYDASAIPEKAFGFGAGFGAPEFTFVEGQVRVFRRFQLGVSYGFMPVSGILPASIDMPEQTFVFSTGDTYSIVPKVAPSFYLLNPFLRYFPSDDHNFYVQVMWAQIIALAGISGNFEPATPNPFLPTIKLGGNITLTQPLPTVSVGYFFCSRIFYFNLQIGLTYAVAASASSQIGVDIPDILGGNESNVLPVDQLNDDIETSINSNVDTMRNSYQYLPSIHLSFGILL